MPSSLDKYDQIFAAAGTEWNVDPAVLKAIAAQESGGDPGAVSKAGAQGLMGIIPSTQKYLGVTDPTDPTQSIYGGAKYLSEALTNEGENPAAALSYYHGGPGWRGAYGPESQGYVPAVAAHYAQYAKANTGSMTDASPAAAPDYNNPPPAVAPQAPAAAPAPATPAPAADPFTAALTGGNKPPPAAPTDDPFTRALGTPAPPPPPQQLGWGHQQPASPALLDAEARIGTAAGHIGQAAIEGWRGGGFQTKEAADANWQRNEQTTMGHYLINPLVAASNVPLRAMGAIGGATGQAAYEAGNAVSPALGRDLYMLNQVAPAAGAFADAPNALMPPRGVQAGPPSPKFVQEYYGEGSKANPLAPLPQAATDNMLSPEVVARIRASGGEPVQPAPPTTPTPLNTPHGEPPVAANQNVPPPPAGASAEAQAAAHNAGPPAAAPVSSTGVPVTPPEEPTPGAAGAAPGMSAEDGAWLAALPSQVQELVRLNAEQGGPSSLSAAMTPPDAATMTPSQARSYRTMAELNEILSPIEGPDYTVHTPGVPHTLAELEGDPRLSQMERVLREKAPDKFDAVTIPANRALVNVFQDHAGTPVSLEDLQQRMRLIDENNHTQVVAASAGRSADLEHIASRLDDFLNDPLNNKRDAVRKVMVPLREAMNDANGELETNPRAVWGMWANVKDKLESAKVADNSAERRVQGQLLDLKKGLGDELNRVSGGKFNQLNEQHAELAKQISAQQILQKKEGTLTNRTTGMINGDAFHRWLITLAQRRGQPGIDPSMDLPDGTMRALINIDNDLKLNGRIDLGKSRGSHTNMMFEVVRAMGLAGAHTATAMATGGPGIANMAVGHGMNLLGSRIGNIRLNQQVRRHLPPEGGWPQQNLLQPPP